MRLVFTTLALGGALGALYRAARALPWPDEARAAAFLLVAFALMGLDLERWLP